MIYIKQLTFPRFLAALLVVIFHFGRDEPIFNLYPIAPIINEGSIAVSFFFFLSGVVLGINYINKPDLSPKSFYKRRFARIYPVYFFAFISTLLLGMIFMDSFPKGRTIILQLLSLHAWYPGDCLALNFPSWSISVEVFFYSLFPFLILLKRKINTRNFIITVIAIWVLSIIQHYYFKESLNAPNDQWFGEFNLYFPLWNLNSFLFGIICALYILKKQQSSFPNYLKPRLFYIIGSIAFFMILGTDNFIKPYTHNGLMSPIFFLIIAGLALDKSSITRVFANKIFVLLGDASYSVYIIQWPLYIIFLESMGMDKLEGVYFYIYLFSLILISIILYKYYEKNMQKIILRKLIKTKHNRVDCR